MISKVIKFFGSLGGYISAFLVVLICLDVCMRYFFNNSQEWAIELEWHMFALIFLFGGAYAFSEDKHVRVDIWYDKQTDRTKAIVNLLGTLLLLIPWCLIIIYTSFSYAENSFAIGERSPDPGGLPARYLIKFAITFGFILLLVQAILQCILYVKTIFIKQNASV